MKKRQKASPATRLSLSRKAREMNSPAPEPERPKFGRRKPREVDLDRTPSGHGTRGRDGHDGSLLNALVKRILG